MAKPKIAIIVGSTRANRFADAPAEWIAKIGEDRSDLDFEVVDLRDYPMPFFDELSSSLYSPSKNEIAQKWQAKIATFDGFLIVAAEYSHGPTGVLKNALDYAYTEWNRKPVAFVGYGGVGGARAVEQLRLIAIELQMAPTRNAVHIVWGDMMAVREGKKLADMAHLNQAAKGVLDELSWLAAALKTARDATSTAKAA